MSNSLKYCRKRDGSIVPFEKNRISNAIFKAFLDANEGNRIIAQKVTESVLEKIVRAFGNDIPSVEDVQDFVEETLIDYNFRLTAKKYILYRDEHARRRETVLV